MMQPLLSIQELNVHYPLRGKGLFAKSSGVVRAVQNVSLTVGTGETLALVGESGCGKTSLGRAIVGLNQITTGRIELDGADITGPGEAAARQQIQMVFQDPFSSLNPRMTVGEILAEPLRIHGIGSKADRSERTRQMIGQVGLPIDTLNRYPHEFSGGQRQRIAIARALGPDPRLIVADEPLSALDVSVQSQILNLMSDLKAQRGLSYLLVSHDLAVVNHLADRVAVMYLGRIVEIGQRGQVFENPRHPYTRALIEAIPQIGRGKRRRGRAISGDVPSPLAPPPGCPFHPRCPKAIEACRQIVPSLEQVAEEHFAACHVKD